MAYAQQKLPFNVLLADDDADERYFFEEVLKEIPIVASLKTVNDGVYLMEYLKQHLDSLPDILFLDINMPRKNGMECLTEIKCYEKLKLIPIVIYSSCNSDNSICTYYQHGASSFLQKGNYSMIIQCIHKVLDFEAGRVFNDMCGLGFVNNTADSTIKHELWIPRNLKDYRNKAAT